MPENTPTRSSADNIAGHYRLRPGRQPGVTGGRPVLNDGVLARLLLGKSGKEVTRNLGAVFTLCAHAHRRTSELALSAAWGGSPTTLQNHNAAQLCLETSRDHLRSMALDWTAFTTSARPAAPDLVWLKDCPLPLMAKPGASEDPSAFDQLNHLRIWLEERVLGDSIEQWLSVHTTSEAFATWCHAQAHLLPPAKYLSQSYPVASVMHITAHDLDILNQNEALQAAQWTELANQLAEQADFAQFPTWHGQCAESGPWTRQRHCHKDIGRSNTPCTVWERMAARWLELLEIVHISTSGDGTPALSIGAVRLEPGQAIAWCEMARGLLIHWVQLDANGHVQDYRVLAPTEWNFHPQGALAQCVAGLNPQEHGQAMLLARAYDPCVGCTVEA